MSDIHATLTRYRARVEQALERYLPPSNAAPMALHSAMRYATLGGGKRVRASLAYAVGENLGASPDRLDSAACALELVHAYSLVHDDLPCMDDDDLRRGKPTCHKAYNEATALLVGDALQSLAFQIIAEDSHLPSEQRTAMLARLAQAIGSQGMAGGQAIDLAAVGRELDLAHLEDMHARKTGALIGAAVALGAYAADADAPTRAALDNYAAAIGLAFQITDDILDVEGETHTLGKQAGADRARNKPTYPALLGIEGAKRMAREVHARALASVSVLGDNAAQLTQIADYLINRRS